VIGEVRDVSAAVAATLVSEGLCVRRVSPGPGDQPLGDDSYRCDLSTPESLRRLHELVRGAGGVPVGGIINLLGLMPSCLKAGPDEAAIAGTVAAWTFNLVREFVGDLQAAARIGSGWFLNVTGLGGQFGLGEEEIPAVTAAGTLGIAKTLQREYPRLRVKNLDVDPHMPGDVLATRLIQELTAADDLMEVGLTRQGRWRPYLKESIALPGTAPAAEERDAVVLVTGGAYGVTAAVARGLAAALRPRLILVGRSPLPAPEAPSTRGLDRTALRQRFIEEARGRGEPIVPPEMERSIGRVLKDRQIRANLEAAAAAGAAVEYHPLDVRDARQFGRLIDSLYERFGRIDGVVHGAGIVEDRRIVDKTPESFARVFGTKVDSAWTLARKLRPESLKFLAFFGSVSGRFGNAGQVDYSAANEVLNKLADSLNRRWPGRVVCINWGPWDGGMVSDELRRLYAAAGLRLISVEEGVAAFLAEIRRTDRTSAEVVIGRDVERMAARGLAGSRADETKRDGMSATNGTIAEARTA
jgi:NAD(P)-dependent dehydrogenase (short-subunit alcohol dehydrogenase family)